MLEFEESQDGPDRRFVIGGELALESCTGLQEYWARHIEPRQQVEIELEDLDTDDAHGLAVLINLLKKTLEGGSRVTLYHSPQMLGHSLYKNGLLREGSGLTLVEPRRREPSP